MRKTWTTIRTIQFGAQPQPKTKISSNDPSCRFLPFLLSHQGNSIFKVISLVIYPLYIFPTKSYKYNGWLFVYLRWLKVWSTQGFLPQSNMQNNIKGFAIGFSWQSSSFVRLRLFDCQTSAWKVVVYLGRQLTSPPIFLVTNVWLLYLKLAI